MYLYVCLYKSNITHDTNSTKYYTKNEYMTATNSIKYQKQHIGKCRLTSRLYI